MHPMKLSIAAAGLTLIAGAVAPAAAHSLQSLENQLGNREKYFQPLNKEAPEFELQDPDGRLVGLADFQGKVVVLHFVYTNCPDVCPLHAVRIAAIQEMVNQTPMRDLVQFVTVTTDPVNDTPEVMRAYGPARGLDPANWTFLTSGPDRLSATRELVEKFGHKFTEVEGGYQVHSVVTHVIDGERHWRGNFHGLKFEPTNFVLFINALVDEHHHRHDQRSDPSVWDRVLDWF